MEASRYLAHLEQEAARLAEVAAKGLTAPVPTAPGWTVEDVVSHVAVVYLHKVECTRLQAQPESWPPAGLDRRESLGLFHEAFDSLVAMLREKGPDAPSPTWWPPDQTVGFWFRRMAQETAIHRVDVEAAHAVVTPVDADLAADGIDEILMLMLAGDWSDEPIEEAAGRSVDILAGGRIWRTTLGITEVTCIEQSPGRALGDDADVAIIGDASDVLLWAWGRGPADPLTVTGDTAVLDAMRRRLALATQ